MHMPPALIKETGDFPCLPNDSLLSLPNLIGRLPAAQSIIRPDKSFRSSGPVRLAKNARVSTLPHIASLSLLALPLAAAPVDGSPAELAHPPEAGRRKHALDLSEDVHSTLNEAAFKTPPQSSKVHTWWHWMDGNITRDGITKDLESMIRQGIVQATIINIGKNYSKEVEGHKIKFNSPEWIEMFQWALAEANRLGITIGTQTIDGYGTTGGPWITPALSMKQYVWSTTNVEGGKEIDTPLAQPLEVEDFYRDVAVIAYPFEGKRSSFQDSIESIKLNHAPVGSVLTDGNPKTEVHLKRGDVIDLHFKSDLEADKLVLLPHLIFCWDDMAKISVQFTLSSSDDGNVFTKISDFEVTGVNQSFSKTFAPTKAKYFRIQFTKDNFKYFDTYPLAEMEFLRSDETPLFSPQIASFFEKTASVFDVGGKVFERSIGGPGKTIDENSVLDLTRFVSAKGELKWNAPPGNWQVIRFGYTSTGVKNDPSTPEGLGLEVDKMDAASLEVHINSYAKKLVMAAGEYKGNTLKFFLMDSWEAQFQTWSKTFPEEFKQRRGYSIIPWLPVLCGQTVGSVGLSEAFLHDFRKTISDLIDINYYKRFSELCHENGMEMHAEAIYNNWGGYPPSEPLNANRHIDFPMTEFWAEQDENNFPAYKADGRPKPGFPTCSALAYDKQLIGSEAYTGFAHYTETPFDLKPFGDAAYCSGVNQLILHSYVHQPYDQKPGMTLGKFGAHFNRNNPWWEFGRDWLTYQSRIQYVLQKGEPVVDVMFYAGDELSQNFTRSFLKDLPFGFQAGACNFEILKERARVIDGRISFGGKQSFPILMLPNSVRMDLETLKRIAGLVKAGAIAYGPKPREMLSIQDIRNGTEEFRGLADRVWGVPGVNHYGKGLMFCDMPIGDVLSSLKIPPDLTTDRGDPEEVMYIHRRIDDTDVYFVFNQQNKALNREILFRMTGRPPEIWDPACGTISAPAIYSLEGAQTRIPVFFKPRESKVFVFKNQAADHNIRKVSLAGRVVFPRNHATETELVIPHATHSNGKFEFGSDQSGEYSFETNEGRMIRVNLEPPRAIELRGFTTKIVFSPFSTGSIPPIEVAELKSLTDFNDPAIKYFAGKAEYTIEFSVPDDFTSTSDSIILNLGDLSATAEVRLNGKSLGYAWIPYSEFDVTAILNQSNKLEVAVANVCRNRFIGDLRQFGDIRSLWTTSPVETILNKDMPLKPSGLMGPVKLLAHKKRYE